MNHFKNLASRIILLLLMCLSAASAEGLVDVKITYADGKVVEKKQLDEQQSLALMVEMVRSGKDGSYELKSSQGEVRFELEGDKIHSVSQGKKRTMTRDDFLKKIAPPAKPDE